MSTSYKEIIEKSAAVILEYQHELGAYPASPTFTVYNYSWLRDGSFTADAMSAIHRSSAGIPRSINVICDNALLSGFALQRKPIRADVIADVCRDFDLDDPTISPARPAPAAPGAPSRPDKKKFPFSFFS